MNPTNPRRLRDVFFSGVLDVDGFPYDAFDVVEVAEVHAVGVGVGGDLIGGVDDVAFLRGCRGRADPDLPGGRRQGGPV